MYLEMLYNLYGSALEKRAAANTDRLQPWKQSYGAGSPWYVRKVTSPTGTVSRYYGDTKGYKYYQNMKPSNPSYHHDYETIPENSTYMKNLNNIFDAIRAGKDPSDEDLRMFEERLTKINKLKRRSVPRYTYKPQ